MPTSSDKQSVLIVAGSGIRGARALVHEAGMTGSPTQYSSGWSRPWMS